MAKFKVIYETDISVVAEVEIPDDEITDDLDDDRIDDLVRGAAEDYLSAFTRQFHGGVKVWADATIDGIAGDVERTDAPEEG